MKKSSASEVPSADRTPLLYRGVILLSGAVIVPALLPAGIFLFSGKLLLSLILAWGTNSFFSLLFYGTDKVLAQEQLRRIPEKNLLLWDLFWGWPGGFLAQHLFRHKTKKISYQIFFWLGVFLNISAAVLIFFYSQQLHSFTLRLHALF